MYPLLRSTARFVARSEVPKCRLLCSPPVRIHTRKASTSGCRRQGPHSFCGIRVCHLHSVTRRSTTNKSRLSSTRRSSSSSNRKTNNSETFVEHACETPADSKLINAPAARGRDDAALSRYPHLQSAGGVLRALDWTGTLTFALTGSVTAAQSGLDVFGCSMVGMVTAIGGGTIRDAVFLSRRPFWTSETEYIWMTVLTGFLTFFAWPHVIDYQQEQRIKRDQKREDQACGRETDHEQDYDAIDAALDTFDAIGLSAFAIVGAQNGVRANMPMVVSAICGMSTATFGGMTRDVLCARPVRIVHSNAEIYAAPALSGAVTYLVVKQGLPPTTPPFVRIFAAFAVCMGSRFLAVKHNVKLHTWDTKADGLGVAVRK